MAWRCPKCDSDNLDVLVLTWARLIQMGNIDCPEDTEYSTDVTEGLDGSHEWDEHSPMACRDCGHSAETVEFLRTDQDVAQEEVKP